VKVSKQARRDAKELFLACRQNGGLDENKVRDIVQQVIRTKPRGYIPILNHFARLVKLEVDRRTARIESPVALSEAQQAALPSCWAGCACRSAATFTMAASRPGWPSWLPVYNHG
jgi:F-type H+-transporting ATPase subunit delta